MDSITDICYGYLPNKEGRIRENYIEPLEKEIEQLKSDNKKLSDENEQLKSQLADYQDKNKLVLRVDITKTDKFKTVVKWLAEAMILIQVADFQDSEYVDRYEKLKSEVEKNERD